jgi:hypothetical protein
MEQITNFVYVCATNPVPVTLTDVNSPDIWPSFVMGFSFGLVVCGFGWVLRIVQRVSGSYD